MEQIQLPPWWCNMFLASRIEANSSSVRRVRVVGRFGLALVTILFLATGCSSRSVDRVRKIQALPRESRTFAKLHRDLASKDPGIRAAAVAAIDVLSGPEAAQAVSAAMGDADARVRSMAALRLGEIRDDASVQLLLQHLRDDPEGSVRLRCAQSLGESGAAGAEAGLSESAADPERAVRLAAVRALSRSFASTSIEILARRLAEDPDWEIRVEAAYGLARSEAGEAIPPLEAAQADVSEFVRAEAASGIAALHKLGLEAPPPEEPGGKDAKPEGGSGSGV